MKNILTILCAGVILTGITACSDFSADVARSIKKSESKGFKFHGDALGAPGKVPVKLNVEVLKQNKLTAYPQKTIGEAFDAYSKAAAKEWQESLGTDGKMYVDFVCWSDASSFLAAAGKDGTVRTGLDIKFAIQENGDTYITLASKLVMKNDGKVQVEIIPFPEIPKLVDSIYNNRELLF